MRDLVPLKLAFLLEFLWCLPWFAAWAFYEVHIRSDKPPTVAEVIFMAFALSLVGAFRDQKVIAREEVIRRSKIAVLFLGAFSTILLVYEKVWLHLVSVSLVSELLMHVAVPAVLFGVLVTAVLVSSSMARKYGTAQ